MTNFNHVHSGKSGKDEWLTPPDIINKLGVFDLDPFSPIQSPFYIAKNIYTEEDNGLLQNWEGRVWCNPPYSYISECMGKMALHGNGIALVFARTETNWFFNYVWGGATSILFLKGRICFYHISGEKAKMNAGAPSVLVAYGESNSKILKNAGIRGAFLRIK